MKLSVRRFAMWAVLLVGCAGTARSCTSCTAESFGADWIVVQMDMSGRPFRCWELRNTSIANEVQSDGIYWAGSQGNLIHISGLYNRVQVLNGQWEAAYREVGVTAATCALIREQQVTLPRDQ